MATILRMPEVAANATHATLVRWIKAEGEPFLAGDCIAEIETDKAVIEVNALEDGVLGKILAPAGSDHAVGAPIAALLAPGESAAAVRDLTEDAPRRDDARAGATIPSGGPAGVAHTTPQASPDPGKRVFSSPVARLLARRHGLDLARVRGTGPNGRIVKYDVILAAALPADRREEPMSTVARAIEEIPAGVTSGARPMSAGSFASTASPWTEIPHSGMRRTIARRLVESKSSVPHFYLTADCRVDRLVELRAQINEGRSDAVSVNDLVLRATALALREEPAVNVAWSDDAILQFERVDLALAVSTPGGLITPIIRDAASRSLLEIHTEARRLAQRARDGQLRSEEFVGGSFCVSNLGMYGVDEFAAIINPPQAGILAVGAVRAQPVVDANGHLAVGQIMRCVLSVDHRVVDGALAARWLAAFRRLIETPVSLLI